MPSSQAGSALKRKRVWKVLRSEREIPRPDYVFVKVHTGLRDQYIPGASDDRDES